VRRAPADSLVGAAYSASITRVPDLSRATFEELVSSGRIELLRSRTVREALANYERAINEFAGLYEITPPGFLWAWEWLPPGQSNEYEILCRGGGTFETVERVVMGICAFEWDLDTGALRAELLREDMRRDLRLITNRNEAAVRVTGRFLEVAEALESVLIDAQPGS
jgi:hypothetical protein